MALLLSAVLLSRKSPAAEPPHPAHAEARRTHIGASMAWNEGDNAYVGMLFGDFYPRTWLCLRNGIGSMDARDFERWFFGMDFGIRVATPTRLAPFAGIGGFLGYRTEREDGEDETRFIATLHPELGCDLWFPRGYRLTGVTSWHFTSEGGTRVWVSGVEFSVPF
jgi:hypothetical protein